MQLASRGARPMGRAPNRIITNCGFGGRAIHIPTAHAIPLPLRAPPAAALPKPSGAQRIVSQARNVASRFFAHLTAPGLAVVRAPLGAPVRALHTNPLTAAARQPAHARLSLPARAALGRPLGAPYLPRPPALPRCSVTTVGLGSARAFHSGRPIFATIAENAPLLARTLCEADVDVQKRRAAEQARLRRSAKQVVQARRARKQMQKENAKPASVPASIAETEEPTQEDEMSHYFSHRAPAAVSTHLLVPLAPTPTSRTPLPAFPSPGAGTSPGRLLPLAHLGSLHASHSKHALRVSSLFARLDTAAVWTRGAHCEAYGEAGGACTVLRVVFGGWEAADVRRVLGEGGQGWCELVEVRPCGSAQDEEEGLLDGLSSGTVTPIEDDIAPPLSAVDPAQSFVLPTLDFSSSFADAHPALVSPTFSRTSLSDSLNELNHGSASPSYASSIAGYASDNEDDVLSDYSLPSCESDGGADVLSLSDSLCSTSSGRASWVGVGFSSRFAARMEEVEVERRPREAMF